MKKKIVSIICLVLCCSFLLAGCGGGSNANVIHTAQNSEPGSLDPALAQGTHESWVLDHLYTGLMKYGKDGKLEEGMSERPEISEDGLTYTFKIKKGMKWSNGDPVTAKDFEYEWLRVLAPETAADYAYQLYYVKGGEAYNSVEKPGVYYKKDDNGKDTKEVDHEVKYTEEDLKGLDVKGKSKKEISEMVYKKWLKEARANVGVKATDDSTLVVTLENPTPYFEELTAFYTYYPVNSKIAKKDKDWAKKAGENYTSNGPFTLKNWEHDNVIELEKNPNWMEADKVKVEGITFDILEDSNTAWQNYDSGKYQILTNPPQEVIAQKLDEKDKELKIGEQVGTYYYNLNVVPHTKDGHKNPFENKNIRKAFSLALNREDICKNVTKGGQKPATGYVPTGLMDDAGKDFREQNGTLIKYDPEEAKALLEKGLEESGLKKEDLNDLVILYNTDENHKKIAQAIQQMWKKTLGVKVGLENADFNVKLSREHAHDFDISRAGWVGDYNDPMTMMDLFVTDGPMDDCGFSNPEYDALIAKAKSTGDQKVRMDAMKQAEKILMEESPIVPVYFYTQPYFVKSNLKDIYKPLLQYPQMTFAEIAG